MGLYGISKYSKSLYLENLEDFLFEYDIDKIPKNLSILNTVSGIRLDWGTPNHIVGLSGYNIYRSYTSDQLFTTKFSTTNTYFYDTTAEINGTLGNMRVYFYRVTADYGTQDTSVYSPSGFQVTPLDTQSLKLTWQTPQSLVSGYRIYRADHWDGQFYPIQSICDGNITEFIDSNLTRNKAYYYRMTSFY